MKKWWLKLRIALTFPAGRRRALRSKYFCGDGRLNPGAYGNNKVIRVEADGTQREIKDWYVRGAKVHMEGRNNTLVLEGEHNFHEVRFDFFGDGAYVRIGRSKGDIGSLYVWMNSGGKLEIGKDFSCCYDNMFWVGRGHMEIGEDCMFSLHVHLRTDDGHCVKDERGEQIPTAGHLKIGNHVWCGEDAYLLKNAVVGDNSIVGARAVVAGKYPQGKVILAGNPARAIKELKGGWER